VLSKAAVPDPLVSATFDGVFKAFHVPRCFLGAGIGIAPFLLGGDEREKEERAREKGGEGVALQRGGHGAMNDRTSRSSIVLGIVPIVAASLVWGVGTAGAQGQQETREEKASESRQETTTQTVRRTEETTTTRGRGVTGDVWRPPANQLSPEYTERERLLYNLGQMPGM
jgi:hypothetical protein